MGKLLTSARKGLKLSQGNTVSTYIKIHAMIRKIFKKYGETSINKWIMK